MHLIKRVDIVFFSFFALTTILLFCSSSTIEDFNRLLLNRLLILVFSVALILVSSKLRFKWLDFLREGYPVLFSGYFYSETVFYNKLFFNNIDPFLIDTESFLFGSQISVSFSDKFDSLLFSELMYFAYFFFYLLIIGYVVYVFFINRVSTGKDIFLLTASLYLFYFLFGLLPSEGPQFYFSSPESQLPSAFVFDKVMHFIQHNAEEPTGAFPSSHVGISIIILMIILKKSRTLFNVALPFVLLLMLSTVYIKAHYLVDVLGGILVAPIVLFVSKRLYDSLAKISIN